MLYILAFCRFKNIFRIYVSTDVAMAIAKIKGVKNEFFKKIIVFNFRNGINRYYDISHPTNFLPCFIRKLPRDDLLKLTKMLEFKQDDVIIYNVNEDFRILLCMWNRPLMCKISQC